MHVENMAYIRTKWRRFGFLCLFIYGLILVYLTLFTHNYYVYGRSFNFDLFDSIKLMWHSGSLKLVFENVIGNVLLFIPLGFFLPLLVRKCRNVFIMFIIGTGTSFLIETMQYEYAKRIFDVDDIFLNVIGAMIGWLVALMVLGIFKLLKKAGE